MMESLKTPSEKLRRRPMDKCLDIVGKEVTSCSVVMEERRNVNHEQNEYKRARRIEP